ncbi:NADH-ubiquinone oxidoreductase-F iron-sulfur binding region domain-containing protein [Frankia sp. Cppng1_Ct_nod]|uniref:NADH-ubiquinone oxidoreductase-F iron-sulfur binding region domain-containing protein n=1 Tax=Frankia sp. Cppng1_Ct_nod TaxID=2897162 RepID=UPI002024B119|nr:NADH-ubiquinone oxidoreductase-F iron-sulfur binding region domain-containing protein [Frankia sp. Cppng1_Ct_nod]
MTPTVLPVAATTSGITALPRLLPTAATSAGATMAVDLAGHLTRHGPLPYRGRPRLLLDTVHAAGLTGRGGAAFPVARKLAAVADAGRRAVVVANGAEGEPASGKDKLLLWTSPHLVLDGVQLAAETVGSAEAFLYVHRDEKLHGRLRAALAERAVAGTDRIPVTLVAAPPRFLAGEESALVNVIDGGEAIPRFTPHRVSESGVGGAPTLVQNVETLAHLALIARHGAGWFRAVGTPVEPGSMLTSCHQADGTPTVVETAIGTPLADLLNLTTRVQAVLVGGYHGVWLPVERARGLKLSNAALRPLGAAVGAGVLAALPASHCGLVETARVVRYLALESAGQCGPCLNGLPRIAAALGTLASLNPDEGTRRDLERWAGLVERRGACHHPDGTVRLVRSALVLFGPEIDRHRDGWCGARSSQPFLPIPAGVPTGEHDWR